MPRSTSKVSQLLTAYLFLSPAPTGQFGDRAHTLALIRQTARTYGPYGAKTALKELAYAYGDHPEFAARRIAACAAAVEAIRTLPAQRVGGLR